MTERDKVGLLDFGFFCGACVVILGLILAFCWCAGLMLHSKKFCEEEASAIANNGLECKSFGQHIEFEMRRDRTWAICRCP